MKLKRCMKDNNIYLSHILDAVEAIETHLAGLSYDGFKDSRLLYDAVLMEFIVIGEQAAALTDEFKEKHPEMPWHKMIGMRNEISHAYYKIKPKIVWDSCKEELPSLKTYLQGILGV